MNAQPQSPECGVFPRPAETPVVSAFYSWRAQDKPFCVNLHVNVVERLEQEFLQTHTSGDRVLFGLLLGRCDREQSLRVTIEGWEALANVAETGGGHYSSNIDERVFEEALNRWRAGAGKRMYAVGFFRSTREKDLSLSGEDLFFVRQHFTPPNSVVLVVRPSTGELSTGTFFVSENGHIRGGHQGPEFPFNRRALVSKMAPEPTPVRRQSFAPPAQPLLLPAPLPARSRTMWFVGVPALAASLCVVGLLEYRTQKILNSEDSRVAAPEPASLDLKAARNGVQWELSWNQTAPAVQSARRGRLSISDGVIGKELELDAGELRTGRIVYLPVSNDVSFRLELFDVARGKTVSESVRVLAGVPVAVPAASAPRAIAAVVPQKDAPTSPARPASRGAPAETPMQHLEAAGPSQERPRETPPDVDNRDAGQHPVAPRETQIAELPPALAGSEIIKVNGVAALLGGTRPLPPAPEPPKSTSSLQRPAPRVGGAVQAPVLVRRTEPIYPAIAAREHLSGTVRVEGIIGKDGYVKNLHATAGDPLFHRAALDAVRRWVYRPGMLNGQPAEIATQIDVTFRPAAAQRSRAPKDPGVREPVPRAKADAGPLAGGNTEN